VDKQSSRAAGPQMNYFVATILWAKEQTADSHARTGGRIPGAREPKQEHP